MTTSAAGKEAEEVSGGGRMLELKSMQVKSPSPIDTQSNCSEPENSQQVVVSPQAKAKSPRRAMESGHSPKTASSPKRGSSPRKVEAVPQSKKKGRREDRRGVGIKKGSRRHHISFIDEVLGQSVAQVFFVESYKEYNKMEERPDNGCRCQVF